ncbi:MAG: hypothetical protein OEZ22_06085 [Spirochaetia bacterium]|nr:hypothetical protein [Spirochaetia bacterium]
MTTAIMKKKSLCYVSQNICIILLAVLLSCQSKQVIIKEYPKEVQDNLWIDEKTVQIVSEENGESLSMPYSERREITCAKAQENIMHKFLSLYKDAKNMKVQFKIYHTLYLENGGCKHVVRFSSPELKELYNDTNK